MAWANTAFHGIALCCSFSSTQEFDHVPTSTPDLLRQRRRAGDVDPHGESFVDVQAYVGPEYR